MAAVQGNAELAEELSASMDAPGERLEHYESVLQNQGLLSRTKKAPAIRSPECHMG